MTAVGDQSHRRRVTSTSTRARQWLAVLAVALGLAIVSWVSKIPTEAQLAGDADGWLTLRLIVRKLTNSGTAWAGLGIVCGWLVRRLVPAAVAGLIGSLLSLAAHYTLGRLFGIFDATIWAEKSSWFVAALIFGAPLGLIGAVARRADVWGLACRLIIPVGAVVEPFVLGMFILPVEFTQPTRFSGIACGVILITSGVAGGVLVVRTAVRRRQWWDEAQDIRQRLCAKPHTSLEANECGVSGRPWTTNATAGVSPRRWRWCRSC